jgi:NAD-dependent SIR2 family protein deacetylase
MATLKTPPALTTDLPSVLQRVAAFITSPSCKSVVLLTGAGMSVGAGIPDFRSPGGLYQTLRPELITATAQQRALMAADPTYVVEKSMFLANSFPYLEVRRPFILGTAAGQWQPTIAHHFASLLHAHTGKLTRLYTQNIDGLDDQVGLPADLLVPVHGSIGRVACERCGATGDYARFVVLVRRHIKDLYGVDPDAPRESSPVLCEACGAAALKPTTVLFGANLPKEFFARKAQDLPGTNLVIAAGTSLVVSPANSIVRDAPAAALRLVVNQEPVGQDLGLSYGLGELASRDLFAQGDCESVFLALIVELGWLEDLTARLPSLPAASQRLVHLAQAQQKARP